MLRTGHLQLLLLAALLMLSGGCGPRNFANENDVLRARVVELEDELSALRSRSIELEAELAVVSAAGDSLSEEIRANTPRLVKIEIGRRSHVRNGDDEAPSDAAGEVLVIYIKPSDGMGRFLQLVGELAVHAAVLPAGGDSITIGRVALSAAEVRAAYRSGFTGTHYTVELPIVLPGNADEFGECDVRVTHIDGLTGKTYEAHSAVLLR